MAYLNELGHARGAAYMVRKSRLTDPTTRYAHGLWAERRATPGRRYAYARYRRHLYRRRVPEVVAAGHFRRGLSTTHAPVAGTRAVP